MFKSEVFWCRATLYLLTNTWQSYRRGIHGIADLFLCLYVRILFLFNECALSYRAAKNKEKRIVCSNEIELSDAITVIIKLGRRS